MIPIRITEAEAAALWTLIRKTIQDNPDFEFKKGLSNLIREAGIQI